MHPLFALDRFDPWSVSARRNRQRPDALEHRPEQAARQMTLGQQEPPVAGVLHEAPASFDEAPLEVATGASIRLDSPAANDTEVRAYCLA